MGGPVSAMQWQQALRANALMTHTRPRSQAAVEKSQVLMYAEQLVIVGYAQDHRWLTPRRATAQADSAVAHILSQHYGTGTSLCAVLSRYALSKPSLMAYVRSQMWLLAAFGHVTSSTPMPTSQQISQFYAAHRSQFVTPRQVLGREIVLSSEAQAEDVLGLWQHGSPFAVLAQKYSTNQSNRMAGGTLGWQSVSPSPSSASAGFLDRHAPDQSGIVHTRFGYAIIEVQAVQGGKAISPSQAARGVSAQLWSLAKTSAFDQWSAAIIHRADVRIL
jgi:hypothetical protein